MVKQFKLVFVSGLTCMLGTLDFVGNYTTFIFKKALLIFNQICFTLNGHYSMFTGKPSSKVTAQL